jgi:hypothetical protein
MQASRDTSRTADTSIDGYFIVGPCYHIEFDSDTNVQPEDAATLSATLFFYDTACQRTALLDARARPFLAALRGWAQHDAQ